MGALGETVGSMYLNNSMTVVLNNCPGAKIGDEVYLYEVAAEDSQCEGATNSISGRVNIVNNYYISKCNHRPRETRESCSQTEKVPKSRSNKKFKHKKINIDPSWGITRLKENGASAKRKTDKRINIDPSWGIY